MKKNRLNETFFHSKNAIHLQVGDSTALEAEEASHLIKVFRAQIGDDFLLADGQGRLLKAKLKAFDKKSNSVQIVEVLETQPKPPESHVKIGFLKGRDLEEVVDTCCQWNPSSIQAIWTDHTQEDSKKDHSKLLQRLEAKAVVALKQSKSLWLTEIKAPQRLEEVILEISQNTSLNSLLHLVLDLDAPLHLSDESVSRILHHGICSWFGPEGGLSQVEIDAILKLENAISLKLGDKRLRAITAPIFTLGYIEGVISRAH